MLKNPIAILAIASFLIVSFFAEAGKPKAATALQLNGTAMIANECSGSIVNVNRSANQNVLIFTSGHCSGYFDELLAPHSKIVNRAMPLALTLNGPNKSTVIPAKQSTLLYASMQGADLAIIEAKGLTYAQLQAKNPGIRIYSLAGNSRVGERMTIISSIWKKIVACKFSYSVLALREGSTTAFDSMALGDPCITEGGYSGSPIINENQQIVGALSTGLDKEPGQKCSENHPCEVDSRGKVRTRKNITYAAKVDTLLDCFNNRGEFDLNISRCELNK